MMTDTLLWKTKAGHVGDLQDQLVENYGSAKVYDDSPVIGLQSMQAKGFLHWKQQLHQKYLDKKKVKLFVEYSLPTPTEIAEQPLESNDIVIPEFDLSDWRISNKEYEEFIKYVRDSIGLRILAEEFDIETYLVERYDDGGDLLDESEWALNWDRRADVARQDDEYYEILQQMYYPPYQQKHKYEWDQRKYMFVYFSWDWEHANYFAEMDQVDYDRYHYECEGAGSYYTKWDRNAPDWKMGKDLTLDWLNEDCQSASVRSHEDRSRFIIHERINVYPGVECHMNKLRCYDEYGYDKGGTDTCCVRDWDLRVEEYDFTSNPDAPVQQLTYRQAVAYYQWLKREQGYIVKHDNVLIKNYIPSMAEFEKLQAGEQVSHPKEVHPLPSKPFRYTVKFYPKPW